MTVRKLEPEFEQTFRDVMAGKVDPKSDQNIIVRLYLINRLKITKQNAIPYQISQVDIDQAIQEQLLFDAQAQILHNILNPEIEISDYSLDDTSKEKIFLYPQPVNTIGFFGTVFHQLNAQADTTPITDIQKATNGLIAYCVAFCVSTKCIYFFSHTTSRNVAYEKHGGKWSKRLRALFTGAKLEKLNAPTVTLNFNNDAIVIEDRCYIFNKEKFEEMANLKEKWIQSAKQVLAAVRGSNYFTGVEKLESKVEKSPRLYTRLALIERDKGHENITPDRIAKFQSCAKDHNIEVKKDDGGKIIVDDKVENNILVYFLADSLVESRSTGNKYISHQQTRVLPVKPSEPVSS